MSTTARSIDEKSAYRADIDGLRAIAILFVLSFHLDEHLLPGGFIGVDMFFVISGFLISSIIFKGLDNNNFNFINFYSRRARRIFPALIPVLIFTCLFGYIFLLSDEYKYLGEQIAASASFAANFLFWWQTGYFDVDAKIKPLLHLWSLGVEEQFYITWPLLVVLIKKYNLSLLKVILLLFFTSFLLNMKYTTTNSASAFFLPHMRFFEILIGCFLAYWQLYKASCFDVFLCKLMPAYLSSQRIIILHNIKSGLGFLFLALALIVINNKIAFPGTFALLPTMGTFLLISSQNAWINKKILSHTGLVFIGLISYPLYLWHWPLLSFLHIIAPDSPFYWKIVALTLALILSIITYIFLEKKILLRPLNIKKLLIFNSALITIFLIGLSIFITKGFPYRLSQETLLKENQTKNWDASLAGNELCRNKFGLNQEFCNIMNPKKTPTIALIGDSHANHYYPGLQKYYLNLGENLINLGSASCPPFFDLESVEAKHPYLKRDCRAVNNALLYAMTNPSIKTVILAARWEVYISKSKKVWQLKFKNRGDDNKNTNFYTAFHNTINKLSSAGKDVVIFLDSPTLDINVNDCIRPIIHTARCNRAREDVELIQSYSKQVVLSIIAKHPQAQSFDPFPYFCNDLLCHGLHLGVPLYRNDGSHLSIAGSEYLSSKYYF